MITDAQGVQWRVSEGHRPDRIRFNDLEGEDRLRQQAGADPRQRLLDQNRDGIDAEVIYPNKGLSMWATPDAIFAQASAASSMSGHGRRSARTTSGSRRWPPSPPPISRAPSRR